jgi:hypothetical protein
MSYPGSKSASGVWQLIIGQMPPHSVYCEAFFGSGRIFFTKRPAQSSIVIDRANTPHMTRARGVTGTQVILGDALRHLPLLAPALKPDAVVYCDPPYLPETRQPNLYRDYEMTVQGHASLLALLQELPCNVMISGYPSKLYNDALFNWRCVRYTTRTHAKTVTECLWCNFAEPQQLHDWRFAGKNFRQRLAFKRLAARWVTKLSKMEARKQGYVMHAIKEFLERGGVTVAQPDIATPEVALPAASVEPDVTDPNASADDVAHEKALDASRQIFVRVLEDKTWKEPFYWAECYLGSHVLHTTSRYTGNPMHPMHDVLDWAQRNGKSVTFDQDFV